MQSPTHPLPAPRAHLSNGRITTKATTAATTDHVAKECVRAPRGWLSFDDCKSSLLGKEGRFAVAHPPAPRARGHLSSQAFDLATKAQARQVAMLPGFLARSARVVWFGGCRFDKLKAPSQPRGKHAAPWGARRPAMSAISPRSLSFVDVVRADDQGHHGVTLR